MSSKFEIQILTPVTKAELVELRDEIRKLQGMGAFELKVPPIPKRPGEMSGGTSLSEMVSHALIGGTLHAAFAVGAEHLIPLVTTIIKRIFAKRKNLPIPAINTDQYVRMDGKGTSNQKEWEITATTEMNGRRTSIYVDNEGSELQFVNRKHAIDPSRTYAIIIGNGEFEDIQNFPKIQPIANNLADMYKVLNDRRLVGLEMDHIRLLQDKGSNEIKRELDIVSQTEGIETLIIYYAGHGQNIGNNRLCLIAKDSTIIRDELHTAIEYSFIEQILSSSPAAQKIVILDACYSGLAAQGNFSTVLPFEPVTGCFTLTSTTSDKASYYNTSGHHTFFTSYLLEVFNTGIRNSNIMLSLDDLYVYTKKKLINNKLPEAKCSPQLKNISPSKFFISGNLSFSFEERLKIPDQLLFEGKTEEARADYLDLINDYPDKQELKEKLIAFEKEVAYAKAIREGNTLFYGGKYSLAASKYVEALKTRPNDVGLLEQLRLCSIKIAEQQYKESSIHAEKGGNSKKNFHPPAEEHSQKRSLNWKIIIIAIISISIFIAIVWWEKNQNEKNESPAENAGVTMSIESTENSTADLMNHADEQYKRKKYTVALNTYLAHTDILNGSEIMNIAHLYESGDSSNSIQKNAALAIEWYQKATQKGEQNAYGNIANLYYEGERFDEALAWYQQAADHNDNDALYMIGSIFADKRYNKKNYDSALYWLHLAADKNVPEARELIATVQTIKKRRA